jgi:uncharacterized protein
LYYGFVFRIIFIAYYLNYLLEGVEIMKPYLNLLVCSVFACFISFGGAKADYQKGLSAYEAGNYELALKEFLFEANAGNAEAQFELGNMYKYGEGVPEDYVEAVKWWRLAAEQGYGFAQNELGHTYIRGIDVPKNDFEAVKWFRMSAEQGSTNSQYNLGQIYEFGSWVIEDDAEAAKWYRLAADQGYFPAQLRLGIMYAKGSGVAEDYVLAYMWWNLAAAQGNESARENKKTIQERMTREQIAEAQKLSREWLENQQ